MFKGRSFFLCIVFVCFLTISCVSANDSLDNFTNTSIDYNPDLISDDYVVYDVNSSDEFLSLSDTLASYDNTMLGKKVIINLNPDKVYTFHSDIEDKHLQNRIFDDYGFVMKVDGYDLCINGNGAVIRNTDEYELGFLYANTDSTIALNNLIICDFKLGIVNRGNCAVNSCKFVNNVNDDILAACTLFNNEGGAIHNYNTLSCYNCTFNSNDAHTEIYKVNGFSTHIPKGGAIFADSNSKTFLFNCNYIKRGDNVFINDNAFVFINTTLKNVNSISNYVFKKSEKSSLCVKSVDIINAPNFEVEVYSANDFINALNTPHYKNWGIKIILSGNINLPDDIYFIIDEPVEIISYEGKYSIKGNDDSYFLINKQATLQIKNTKISNFDLVFNNYGHVCCVDTYFNKNEMVMENIGGYFNFTNCDFTNLKLGSIYSEGKTISYIVNCTFKNGEGLSVWEKIVNAIASRWETQDVNVYSIDSKIILVNSICSYKYDADKGGIISKRNNLNPIIKYINVSDSKSLRDAGSKVWQDKGNSDQIIINFTNYNDFDIDFFDGNLFHPRFTTLIFNGQGNIIKAKNNAEDDLFKFILIEKNCFVYINNLILSNFNTAILNYGYCVMNHSTLSHNRINTCIKEDYGGAIDNRGILICVGCSFEGNYAKYGGAIYNICCCKIINSTFYDNTAYKSDGCNDVYNHNSAFTILVNSYCKNIKNCYGMSKLDKDLLLAGTELATMVFSYGIGAIAASTGSYVVGAVIGTIIGSSFGICGILYVAEDSQNWNGYDVSKQIFHTVVTALAFAGWGARETVAHKNPSNKISIRSDMHDITQSERQFKFSKNHPSLKDFYNDPRSQDIYGGNIEENSVSSDSFGLPEKPLPTYKQDVDNILVSRGTITKLNPNGLEPIPEEGNVSFNNPVPQNTFSEESAITIIHYNEHQ